ncbi:MAG: hypothetical protein KAS32_10450 [Candidatus Peribacteraceae bacterium]|nr:hypothetical protein [Candidatus Peribacteraceae bacterium]
MASGIYNRFKANLMNKEIDLEADTIKVALLNTSHSFTATHNTWSQVSANEISGTGYTANGQNLAGKAVTQAATTKFDATDIEWTTATFTTYHAVIYDDTMTNDDLIMSLDFGGAQTVTAATFKIQWHADGIITLA